MIRTTQYRKTRFIFLIIFFIGISIIFNSCIVKLQPLPTRALCTFSIPEPRDFDCYRTVQPLGRKIKLFIVIKVTVMQRTSLSTIEKVMFDERSITVEPVVGPGTIFPILLNAEIPNDSSPFLVETFVQGEECSTCANGYSDAQELPYGVCVPFTISTLTPGIYRAAKPRWMFNNDNFYNYSIAKDLTASFRIPNAPNSCGCTVSGY